MARRVLAQRCFFTVHGVNDCEWLEAVLARHVRNSVIALQDFVEFLGLKD